jgi:hypothetical protein
MPRPSTAAPPMAAEPQSNLSPREAWTIVGAGRLDEVERWSGTSAALRDTIPAAKMSASVTIILPDTQFEVRALTAGTLHTGGH